jgi:polyisoprenoid-binding protein YceI
MAVQYRAAPSQTRWELTPSNTRVEFTVKNFRVRTVHGRFARVQGELSLEGDTLSSAHLEAQIGAASIETGITKRDTHLRSADFLDADEFPAITYRSVSVDQVAEDRLRMTGYLTIRDTTREVDLDVALQHRDGQPVSAVATTTLNRRDFGVGERAGTFMVGDILSIQLTFEPQV